MNIVGGTGSSILTVDQADTTELRSTPATIAEIDLAALVENYHALRTLAGGAEPMAVIKADAYGHGAIEVARALVAEGCRHLGVARICEARDLRHAGIASRIYLMGGLFAEDATEIVSLNLTPFVFDVAAIGILDLAARALGRKAFPVHLKIDSGAGRLGVTLDQLETAIAEFRRAESLTLEGVCTLLADAGNPSSSITNRQVAAFKHALAQLEAAGLKPRFTHLANSAAAVLRPDRECNMFRPGLSLYGLPPVPAVRERVELKQVMTFKTRVLQTKRMPAGSGVSYGHTFVTSRPSVIGVLPVGYADGYRRGLQHGGEVLIRGQRAPVVGAVCMDLTMVDLTDVADVAPGDEVILWGGVGEHAISVNDVARLVQTIPYELLCTVGKRVPRIYRGRPS
ncbi:MAG TPA: alanine racemase [Candidatus Binataceae bacterium]|nr:alanine racemase [Candidatus Binataceae bacterium]